MPSNRYYDHGTYPANISILSSAAMRAELDAIETGFISVQNDVDAAVVSAVGAVGLKNPIINARMKVAQRTTVKTGIGPTAGDYFTVDRWRYDCNTTSAVVTQARIFDHPMTPTLGFCLGHTVTTAEAAFAAAEHATVMQHVEGPVYHELKDKQVTVSFWVKSPKTGIHCLAIRNGDLDRSLVKEYTVNAANTWEQKSLTFTFNASGTWGYTPGLIGFSVIFPMGAGSNFHTTADVWQNGNFIATANQQNLLDTIGNSFRIADIQIDRGTTATTIEDRPFGLEHQLCERYYEKSYDYANAPGFAYTPGTGHQMAAGPSGGNIAFSTNFRVAKRATPTLTIYDAAGTSGKVSYYDGTWKNNLAYSSFGVGQKGFHILASGASTTVIDLQWVADAEL